MKCGLKIKFLSNMQVRKYKVGCGYFPRDSAPSGEFYIVLNNSVTRLSIVTTLSMLEINRENVYLHL